MKKILLLTTLLIFGVGSFAQNPLFVSFDNNYHGLKDHMKETAMVKIIDEDPNERLVVEYHGGVFTYFFNRGWLYKTAMQKQYPDKKVGKKALEGCLTYFEHIQLTMLEEVKDEKKHKHFIYTRDGLLYNLEYFVHENGKAELLLSSRFVPKTPVREWDDADRRVADHIGFEQEADLESILANKQR